MTTEEILEVTKWVSNKKTYIQNLEDLNMISHEDLRGIKRRNSQTPINKNDSICRGFQKYTWDILFITILFLRGRSFGQKDNNG